MPVNQPIIHTKRLQLRVLHEQDRELVVSLYTDPKIMRNTAEPFTLEHANTYFGWCLAHLKKPKPKGICWAICQQSDQQAVGIITLYDIKDDQASIGIMLTRQANGKLYPEEAMQALMHHSFTQLQLTEIHAHFFTGNLATKRFVKKLGFEFMPLEKEANAYHCVMKKAHWRARAKPHPKAISC